MPDAPHCQCQPSANSVSDGAEAEAIVTRHHCTRRRTAPHTRRPRPPRPRRCRCVSAGARPQASCRWCCAVAAARRAARDFGSGSGDSAEVTTARRWRLRRWRCSGGCPNAHYSAGSDARAVVRRGRRRWRRRTRAVTDRSTLRAAAHAARGKVIMSTRAPRIRMQCRRVGAYTTAY